MLVMAADPLLELLARLVRYDLDGIVHASDPYPFARKLIDLFKASSRLLNRFVSSPPIHIKDDRIGSIQHRFVLGPAIERDVYADRQSAFLEASRKELNTSVELVHSRGVRRSACNQYDLFDCRVLRGLGAERMVSKEPGACVRQQSKNQHPACSRKAHRFVLQGKRKFQKGGFEATTIGLLALKSQQSDGFSLGGLV